MKWKSLGIAGGLGITMTCLALREALSDTTIYFLTQHQGARIGYLQEIIPFIIAIVIISFIIYKIAIVAEEKGYL
ncbi:hypothetical protein MBCUT_05880 [Methanobrevibacter cuticularis]|uniref:Uncharacterized protein n=1 Tax=Methanobrevibacter cuticularis TaxID=47311 RepID=A0A166EJI1_9EURY|nr:hypothetical protein [Methanobrevibacter cuticularis]KZX16724.1 hypothetical protein MBCUT_05880 [Methanobrevibacter cuticularis]